MRKKIGECPLGSKCSELKQDDDGPYLSICPWWIEMSKRDELNQETEVEGRCSINWIATFSAQESNQLVAIQKPLESLRNLLTPIINYARIKHK